MKLIAFLRKLAKKAVVPEATPGTMKKWQDQLVSLVETHKNMPVLLRLLGGLVPLASGVFTQFDVKLSEAIEKRRIQRIAEFLEECKQAFPTDQDVAGLESEFFIHAFSLISRAVVYTGNKKKLRFFARLLRHSCSLSNETEADEIEQMIRMIDDLSWRELELVAWINRYDQKHSLEDDEFDHHKTWLPYRDDLIARWGLSHAEFEDALVRLNRSGLCVYPVRPEDDLRPYYPRLTRFFRRFCETAAISKVDF